MIILREKEFGQVKRENKAKKKAWEEKIGKDYIKELYNQYLKEDANSSLIDTEGHSKETLRRFGRKYNIKKEMNDDLLRKSDELNIFGDTSRYYKNKLGRFKFEKDKSSFKNEEDLLDKYFRGYNKLEDRLKTNDISTEKSIPLFRRVKRLFKKNINKLIK